MWPWILLALLASLIGGFLLGVLSTRHSLDAAAALQQNAAQLLDLHRMETGMLRLWKLLKQQQEHQKAWTEKLDRMDVSQAAIIKALHRMGGIGIENVQAQHGRLSLGDRPGRADGPPPKKSDSDALGGHI